MIEKILKLLKNQKTPILLFLSISVLLILFPPVYWNYYDSVEHKEKILPKFDFAFNEGSRFFILGTYTYILSEKNIGDPYGMLHDKFRHPNHIDSVDAISIKTHKMFDTIYRYEYKSADDNKYKVYKTGDKILDQIERVIVNSQRINDEMNNRVKIIDKVFPYNDFTFTKPEYFYATRTINSVMLSIEFALNLLLCGIYYIIIRKPKYS